MPIKCFESSVDQNNVPLFNQCLEKGNLGFGEYVLEFEKEFKSFSNLKHNIGYSSASSAAEAIFCLIYEKYGRCNIYTPSLTFISPCQAAKKAGHMVCYVDVDDNLLFDVEDYVRKRATFNLNTGKTVIMPMLYGGVSEIPNMNKLIGDEIVVVDSAHCVTPKIRSDYIFFSFHTVKPISMGNGGIIATDNDDDAEYFRKFRNFGRIQLGHSYDIIQDGSNSYMNNLNASIGLTQIRSCIDDISARRKNHELIQRNLKSDIGRLVRHDKGSSYYLCTLVLDEKLNFHHVKGVFDTHGIQTTQHYPPIHTFTHHKSAATLKNTENLVKRLINLPIHQNLTKHDMKKVVLPLEELSHA